MIVLLYISAAIISYLISGINPAIIISKAVYHKDIREYGSGNPGFTNFKRTFGGAWAWLVMFLDIFKGIIAVSVFGYLFELMLKQWQLGVAYSGFFAMLGHIFPIWYKFKGGKGFLVCMSVMWLIDWRAGVIAVAIMLLILLTTKYMSLADICAIISCPITLIYWNTPITVTVIAATMTVLMIWRHKENIKRLINGKETKFSLTNKR